MEIKQFELKDLIPYANNPRKKQAIDKVASSIKEFGWQQPIVVDESNVIIVGHTRYQAAQKLGLDKAPVQVAKGLSDAQVKAYRILDNRANQDALWDDDMLKIEVQDIDKMDIDLALTGFDEKELDKLLFVEQDGLTDEDAVPEDVEPKVKKGELWQLGNHRLLCGDATSEADVATLMDNQKADMIFTDPPYNIDYQGIKDKRKIKNDKMDDNTFVDFLTKSLIGCETMYVCCSWQYAHLFRKAMINIARKPKAMIIWDKVNPAQNLDKYYKQHEIIYYYGDFGGQKTLRGDVWSLKRKKNTLHPTMKPVELICLALSDQANKKIIYDGFLGSGSTIIACEKTNRNCYGLELDPKYCDVIIKRWEDFTGQTAKLLERGTDTNSFKEDEQWQDQKNIKSTEKKSLN